MNSCASRCCGAKRLASRRRTIPPHRHRRDPGLGRTGGDGLKLGDALDLSSADSFLVYEIPAGHNWLTVDLTSSVAWTASAVVTASIGATSGKQRDFPGGAVTFNSLGVQDILEITGVRYIRFQVTTAQAGTCMVAPVVNTGKD